MGTAITDIDIRKPDLEDDAAEATDADDDDVDAMRRGKLHDVGDKLKSGASAAMEKIGPAMSGLGDRAKSLWGKAQEGIARRRADPLLEVALAERELVAEELERVRVAG